MDKKLASLKANVELSDLLVVCGLSLAGAMVWDHKNNDGQFWREIKSSIQSVLSDDKSEVAEPSAQHSAVPPNNVNNKENAEYANVHQGAEACENNKSGEGENVSKRVMIDDEKKAVDVLINPEQHDNINNMSVNPGSVIFHKVRSLSDIEAKYEDECEEDADDCANNKQTVAAEETEEQQHDSPEAHCEGDSNQESNAAAGQDEAYCEGDPNQESNAADGQDEEKCGASDVNDPVESSSKKRVTFNQEGNAAAGQDEANCDAPAEVGQESGTAAEKASCDASDANEQVKDDQPVSVNQESGAVKDDVNRNTGTKPIPIGPKKNQGNKNKKKKKGKR